jgi:hypothetical protein
LGSVLLEYRLAPQLPQKTVHGTRRKRGYAS